MSQELVLDSNQESAVQFARMLYIAHAVTFFFSLGMLNLVPLIVNYVKRGEVTVGSLAWTHHTWMIRSFWWMVLWMVIGWACFITLLGIPAAILIWFGAWLWEAYRLIRGFVDLNNNRPADI